MYAYLTDPELDNRREAVINFAKETIKSKNIDLRKKYMTELYYHSFHVAEIAVFIGQLLTLNTYELIDMATGAILHDYGKSFIDPVILYKDGPLTDEEYEEVKMHPKVGYEGLLPYHFNEQVMDIVLHHHERPDGTGYPDGISDIKLYTRIVTVSDIFDAIHQKRAYHDGKSSRETMKILKQEQGLDPVIVKIFEEAMEKCDYEDVFPKKNILKTAFEI